MAKSKFTKFAAKVAAAELVAKRQTENKKLNKVRGCKDCGVVRAYDQKKCGCGSKRSRVFDDNE